MTPKGPKVTPKAPKTTQNRPQSHLKSDFSEKVKTHQNQCIYHGLATSGCPLPDTFAIKTAIVEQTANSTPQNGENVSQVVPNVAQVSQNGPPGGSA